MYNSEGNSSRGETSSTAVHQPPPHKKSRLLGGVDINSPDVQKLIRAKSAHMSLVDEVSLCALHYIDSPLIHL